MPSGTATWIDLQQLLHARANLLPSPALPSPARPLGRVRWDNREVGPGDVFIAKSGLETDGHLYVPDAVAAGAALVLGTEPQAAVEGRCAGRGLALPAYLHVKDSERAFAQASALWFGFPARKLTTVGITGTDGKTTTVGLLTSILETAHRSGDDERDDFLAGAVSTLGFIEAGRVTDSGFHVTTPDAWNVQAALDRMVGNDCRIAVLECTSHGLAQHRTDEIDLNLAGFTNITHEHLDYHGTLEAYVAAKCSMLDLLSDRSNRTVAAIFNADDPVSRRAVPDKLAAIGHGGAETDTYSRRTGTRATWTGLEAEVRTGGVAVRAAGPGNRTCTLRAALVGEFNVSNLLLATALAHRLGCSTDAIEEGIGRYRGTPGRMEPVDVGQAFRAYVDFAHTPGSMEAALSSLRRILTKEGRSGRLIAVFGCAGLRDVRKRDLMGAAAGRWADHVVITAEDPRTEDLRSICREIEKGVASTARGTAWDVVLDRAEALEHAVAGARPQDIVVACGKGHEQSMCFGTTEYPWSDRLALRLALERSLGMPVDTRAPIYGLPTGNGPESVSV